MPLGIDRGCLWVYAGRRNVDTAVPIASFQRFHWPAAKPLRLGLPRRCTLVFGSLAILTCLLPAAWAKPVTLAELRADSKLTPARLMAYFADFKFEPSRQVRQPETFLAGRSGDCDDFATLAADLLREKGYSPRLVAVFMARDVHVICYVPETRSYLDFNRRKLAAPLVKCDGDLGAIASRVAQSFRSPWRSVSEFTFRRGVRRFVSTVFH